MSDKKVCPICGEKFSDIARHLVLEHKVKDIDDLQERKKVDTSIQEDDKIEKNLRINWNTYFYRTFLKLESERRSIYKEKYIEELIENIDKVDNKNVIEYAHQNINSIQVSNIETRKKLDTLKQKFFEIIQL